MKSILIIGMGRFGHHLAHDFLENGHDVMIIDEIEEKVEDMVPYATSTKIGDCTKEEVLKSLGIKNFDVVFVCIGSNFQSSLEITSLVKELGAKRVVSKATRDIQAKFLLRNGADEVIHPDKEVAQRFAAKFSNDNLFDYIELQEGYSINEISPLKEWIGKTLVESDIRAKYNISVIGISDSFGALNIAPGADYVIKSDDHLMVIGHNDDIEKVLDR